MRGRRVLKNAFHFFWPWYMLSNREGGNANYLCNISICTCVGNGFLEPIN